VSNKNYESGRAFEYRVKRHLESKGYYVVRSYASKGTFDLVAVPPKTSRLSRALLIQAKHSRKGKGYVRPEEARQLGEAAKRYEGFCLIAYNEKRKLKYRLVNPYV